MAKSWGLTVHWLMRCAIVLVPMMAWLAMKSLLAPIGVAFCYNSPWHGMPTPGTSSMLRRLLNIASSVCVIACVALMVGWVRSHSYSDDINTRLGPYHGLEIRSSPGLLGFEQYSLDTPSVWPGTMSSVENKGDQELLYRKVVPMNRMGFGGSFSWPRQKWMLPYWFLVLGSGLLAIGLRTKWPPWRFSLRTFLIATMFLAVVLGMMSWRDRSWLGRSDVLRLPGRNVVNHF